MRSNTTYKTLLLTVVLLTITGCERVTYHQIVPISGYLETPDGKHEFETISERKAIAYNLDGAKRISHSYLAAEGEDIKVFFSRSSVRTLKILSLRKNAELTTEDAYIQVDGAPPEPARGANNTMKFILGKRLYKSGEPTDLWYGDIALSKPRGSSTSDGDAKYRYYIPFKLNDTPYLINMEFTYKEKTKFRWEIGVSAMP